MKRIGWKMVELKESGLTFGNESGGTFMSAKVAL